MYVFFFFFFFFFLSPGESRVRCEDKVLSPRIRVSSVCVCVCVCVCVSWRSKVRHKGDERGGRGGK